MLMVMTVRDKETEKRRIVHNEARRGESLTLLFASIIKSSFFADTRAVHFVILGGRSTLGSLPFLPIRKAVLV